MLHLNKQHGAMWFSWMLMLEAWKAAIPEDEKIVEEKIQYVCGNAKSYTPNYFARMTHEMEKMTKAAVGAGRGEGA